MVSFIMGNAIGLVYPFCIGYIATVPGDKQIQGMNILF